MWAISILAVAICLVISVSFIYIAVSQNPFEAFARFPEKENMWPYLLKSNKLLFKLLSSILLLSTKRKPLLLQKLFSLSLMSVILKPRSWFLFSVISETPTWISPPPFISSIILMILLTCFSVLTMFVKSLIHA